MLTAEQILDALGRGAFVGASDVSALLAAKFSAVPVSVKELGAVGDGSHDDSPAFAEAIASGRAVLVPKTEQFYKLTGPLALPARSQLIGVDGRPTLKFVGQWTGGNIDIADDDVIVRDLIVDCDPGSKTSSNSGITISGARAIVENVDVVNHFSDGIRLDAATGARIRGIVISNPDHGPSIVLNGATDNSLEEIEFVNSTGFCVYLEKGSARNRLSRLRTVSSALELVGITHTCFENEVAHCHAEGCGDNGISVTGYRNRILSNACIGNEHSGIQVYGSDNIVIGNECRNNDTAGGGFAGIRIQGAFGGLGYRNIVAGNTVDDDQEVATQDYGVRVLGGGYSAWAQGQNIDSLNDYRVHNLNVYKPASTGVTGAVAPTHTAGAVSDGGVDWVYVGTFETNDSPRHNIVTSNRGDGNVTADFDDATGGSTPNLLSALNLLQLTNGDAQARIVVHNGSPEGTISAPTGSVCLRPGGSTGITVYVKASGVGATGWEPLQHRTFGTTAQRPSNVAGSGYTGYRFFDTTLGKPVWWNGNAWVDATGTAV